MSTGNPFIAGTTSGEVVHPALPLPVDPDLESKKLFAEELLRDPMNPFKAAMKAFAGNIQVCTFAVANWQNDKIVLDAQSELIETHGIESFLPNSHAIIHNAWSRAQDTRDNDEFVKLTDLVARLMGLIKKDGPTVTTNVQLNVMEVPLVVDDTQWQEQAVAHQKELQRISKQQQDADKVIDADQSTHGS